MGRKIIITVLSTFPRGYKTRCKREQGETGNPITYLVGDKEIKAEWTNEAGLKYFLDGNTEYTDIICLCSKETSNEEYEKEVLAIIEERNSTLKDKIQRIEYSLNDDVKTISGKLMEKFTFSPSDIVYIDTTGGARTVAYYLVYLFRYLEYIGVTVESAIYSQINRTEDGKLTGEGTITNVKDNFRMFDLINGAHEFTSTGNPKTLSDYFAGSENEHIKNLLKAMQKFYDQISLCRIGSDIDKSLTAMDKCLLKIENNPQPSDNETRLKEIIPVIRKKFFPDNKSRYLGLIKWCLDNGLIQQAVTIYIEKMPKAYFTEFKFLCLDDVNFESSESDTENKGHDEYHHYFRKIIDRILSPKIKLSMKNVSDKDIKKLCLDYKYMQIVRNYVNHASERKFKSFREKDTESILLRENSQLYKLPKENNFSAKDIKSFIIQSVKYIENIKLKN